MKVVAATPLYPPGSRVGAWLATHRFLAHMVERGHPVDVVTALADGNYTLDGVTVRQSRTSRNILGGADILVTHNGACESWVLYACSIGVRNVRMVHSFSGEESFEMLTRTPTNLAVFSSHHLRDVFNVNIPSIVCHPITIGDDHRCTPGDAVTLVNTNANKGGQLFRLLATSLPHRRFLAVRGGYGTQLNMSSSNCTTFRQTQDMREVWSQTRILAMPSQSESWGMVGVEAMASGIPVIAHPCDGLLESLGSAGIFVDRGDLDGWRREVERLHDPVEWAAASTAALRRFDEIDHEMSLSTFALAVEALGGAIT